MRIINNNNNNNSGVRSTACCCATAAVFIRRRRGRGLKSESGSPKTRKNRCHKESQTNTHLLRTSYILHNLRRRRALLELQCTRRYYYYTLSGRSTCLGLQQYTCTKTTNPLCVYHCCLCIHTYISYSRRYFLQGSRFRSLCLGGC